MRKGCLWSLIVLGIFIVVFLLFLFWVGQAIVRYARGDDFGQRVKVVTNMPSVPMGSLFYPVKGYNRDTGECVGGLGSSEWNEAMGGSPVVVTPAAGFYCFGDAAYREQTIGLMKANGFSWVLISWNGWGDVDFDGDVEAEDFEAAHNDIIALLDWLKSTNSNFKVALLVEPYMNLGEIDPGNMTAEQKATILDKIWNDIYEPYSDVIFDWEGKPLIVPWFPVNLGEDDRYTIKTFGSSPTPQDANLDWNWYPDLEKYPDIISSDGFICFAPRFDEYWLYIMRSPAITEPRRMDPYLEEDIYRQFWQVAAENKSDVKLRTPNKMS